MMASNTSHDRFFKAVFGRTEVAAEFLERYLPVEVAATLNWATLRAEKDAFLDPELALHPADLLYTVDLRGGTGYVHVLFEHKLLTLKYIFRRELRERLLGGIGPVGAVAGADFDGEGPG